LQYLAAQPNSILLAESHYHSICDWLGHEESELYQFAPDLYPQGSVALGTTVKPQTGDEYDVDLVCELNVDYRSVPKPVLLLDVIEKRMRQNERYRDRLERKKRCLRVSTMSMIFTWTFYRPVQILVLGQLVSSFLTERT
jgi:hypothetical protein